MSAADFIARITYPNNDGYSSPPEDRTLIEDIINRVYNTGAGDWVAEGVKPQTARRPN